MDEFNPIDPIPESASAHAADSAGNSDQNAALSDTAGGSEPSAPQASGAQQVETSLQTSAVPGVSSEQQNIDQTQTESVQAKAPKSSRKEGKSPKMDWYILKVQTNREESIKEGLLRRVAIAGLDYYFGDVIVPTEQVTEVKAGKKRVRKRKLYPGYLVVQMEINDDTWFLVRETPGIGDFTGAAGRPSPMLPHEVAKILAKQEEKSEKAPKLNISFRPGDQVKINEGTFENFEGQVQSIDEQNGRVTVMINIFGRSTPVELEYWQIGSV